MMVMNRIVVNEGKTVVFEAAIRERVRLNE